MSSNDQAPDPEVPAKARTRTYSAAYKARILEEYDGLDKAGFDEAWGDAFQITDLLQQTTGRAWQIELGLDRERLNQTGGSVHSVDEGVR